MVCSFAQRERRSDEGDFDALITASKARASGRKVGGPLQCHPNYSIRLGTKRFAFLFEGYERFFVGGGIWRSNKAHQHAEDCGYDNRRNRYPAVDRFSFGIEEDD